MGSSQKKVLIVDDEPVILDMLAQSLAVDHERYGVVTARNGQEGFEILSRENVFLVISDIVMPEISGLHLLAQIRANYPQIEVILMTGYPTGEIKRQGRQGNCLHFLEKPIKLRHLLEMIREQIAINDQGFAGTLKNIQLMDLIQMCCYSGITMAVSVMKGSQQGTINIKDGEIVHAVCGNMTGENAFYNILGWQSGSFETIKIPSPMEHSIDKNYNYLLLEAARLSDLKTEEEKLTGEQICWDDYLEESVDPDEQSELNSSMRVLIVDDSPTMCKILTKILTVKEEIEVVGTAQNGEEALERIDELKPDVVTLDVNMPIMDGSSTLKHIMIKKPCPVIIISSIGNRSQKNILDFLHLGAVDFVSKPEKVEDMVVQQQKIIEKIRTAATAKIGNFKRGKDLKVMAQVQNNVKNQLPCKRLVVINSGAGGFTELVNTIHLLPSDMDASILVLHEMPPEFVSPLSCYLNDRTVVTVLPIQEDVHLLGGICYIGTTGARLKLNAALDSYTVSVEATKSADDRVDYHFSDFLHSVYNSFDGPIKVVLLSGAMVDNLDGLRCIKEKNGQIIVQPLASSMVPEQLEKAIQAGLVDREADAEEIINQIRNCENECISF
ncbi:MAG: response regulator [Desulfobacterales bacterium]|jgi:two-component system chemotaxis response regulator CheB